VYAELIMNYFLYLLVMKIRTSIQKQSKPHRQTTFGFR